MINPVKPLLPSTGLLPPARRLRSRRRSHGLLGALAVVLAGGWAPGVATAQPAADLVQRINAYRAEPQTCQGRRMGPAGPLAPADPLVRVSAESGETLQQALRDAGYLSARVQAISVSGPASARAAFSFIAERHCNALLDPRFADIGVRRNGNRWHVVLAQPLLSPDLGDWRQAGRQVLDRVNAARAEPRDCGDAPLPAAPPLRWNERLGATALAHSRDMASRNYFSHTGHDGSRVGDRATREGYSWRRIGENIATGQGSAAQVVAGWLTSPGHCANLMNRHYTEMGAAFAIDSGSDTAIYWTQVFGTPR